MAQVSDTLSNICCGGVRPFTLRGRRPWFRRRRPPKV